MLLQRGCTWLTLMPLLLSLSTGELNFYRDALPETSEDIALKQLTRYLEAQRLQQQRLHRSHLSPFLSPVHKKHVQEERNLLETLTKKVAMENLLKQLKTWKRHHQHQYHDPVNHVVPERDYSLPYQDLGFKLDYPELKPNEDGRQNYGDGFGYGYEYKARTDDTGYESVFDTDRGIMENPINFHGKYMDHAGVLHEGDKQIVTHQSTVNEPKFTFKFDDSNLQEKHPFAVKPNDPRYYNDAPFSSDDLAQQHSPEIRRKEEEVTDEERVLMKYGDDARGIVDREKSLTAMNTLESERITGHHPLIVPVIHDLNNDIYFIAIVAGCSATAMFALVLISLTWCRLQRGVKAAADIEYPAYGVTGPNKDVSPSGDQRLAQSAQMYHFQHQKQQIIAMENRTSATRDPGSLSEVESDEENEEGDYTVYECPGLASTGEMEVKNPMFHDDPTPATPAIPSQSSKEEDHI